MTRRYTPTEGLKMASADNARLLAFSDRRDPYPGKWGVEVGVLADLLLVNGDPIVNIGLLADLGKDLIVIMKDGQIVKKTSWPRSNF